jgi:hypothetical protein
MTTIEKMLIMERDEREQQNSDFYDLSEETDEDIL